MATKPILSTHLLATALFIPPTIVSADDHKTEAGWSYQLLLGVEREPAYVGSDTYTSEAAGDFQATYQTRRGHQYFISFGETGANFKLGNDWHLGMALEYEEGRDNGDDPILTHFAEVRNTVEAQITLAKTWGDWTIAGVLQPDILNRGKGFVYFLAASYEQSLTDKLSMELAMDISFANAEHLNTEVGISDTVSALSGLDAYTADSGYKSTTLGLGFTYDISSQWQLLTEIETEFYGSQIADSPLVKDEGDDINYQLGLGVQYLF